MTKSITSLDNFNQIVAKKENSAIICFESPNSLADDLASSLPGAVPSVKVYKVDVSSHPDIKSLLGAKNYPAVVLYNANVKKDVITGAKAEDISTKLKSLV